VCVRVCESLCVRVCVCACLCVCVRECVSCVHSVHECVDMRAYDEKEKEGEGWEGRKLRKWVVGGGD